MTSLRVKDTKTVKGTLIQSINTVALNRKNWFQLVSYCHQLIAHYKLKEITATFDIAWTLKKQKQRALDLGTVNGVKLSQLGAEKFGKELDKLMDAIDKEKRDPSQPTGATTTVKKEPMQQQQGVLEECSEYMTMTEADGVAFKDSTLGTIIKQKAISIYCKWKNDMPLSDQELHWMACGLSSILDLTKTDLTMEFLDCTKDELEQVPSPLVDKRSRKQYHLPALVNQTYDIVVSLIEKEHNVKKAILYIQQIKTSCLDTERLLAALVTLIKIVDTNAFLLNPDNSARVTEYDFITQVWAPILKSLIDIHGVLRMKIGESSPAQGIVCRKRSYSDARVGFKVDLRLLFDSRQNEHDLLALEAAKAGDASKLCHDICKLMREAKDNLDAILQHILKRHMKMPVLSWYMHTNGVSAHTGTVHIAKAGLYLALHESKIHFPRNLASLQVFKNEFVMLISMVFDLERNALMIKKSMDLLDCRKDSAMSRHVDPDDCLDANSCLSSMRPTFYNPPRDQVSLAVLPANLFGAATTAPVSSVPSPPCHTDLDPDEYGWAAMDNGQFYHIHTGITADRHPFDEKS